MLRRMWAEAQPTPEIAGIEDELPAMEERIAGFLAQTEIRHIDRASGARLAQLREPWLLQRTSIQNWHKQVRARLGVLAKLRSDSDAMRATWTATRDAAAADLPEVVRDRVVGVLSGIESLQLELRSRFDGLLRVDGMIATLDAEVTEVLGRFDAAAIGARRRLLTRDPQWSWSREPRAEGETGQERFLRLWSDVKRDVREFGRAYSRRLVLHAVLLAALAVAMVALRRAGRRAGVEVAPSIVLSHPWATGLLIALLLTPWVYPMIPGVVGAIARLTGLGLTVRLLPRVLPAAIVPLGYVLTASWIVILLTNLLLEPSGAARLVMLLAGAVAFSTLARFLARAAAAGVRHWLLVAARIAAPLVALAVLATLAGYVAVAELILGAVLGGVFFALALWLAGCTTIDLLTVATRTPPLTALRALQADRERLLRRARTVIEIGTVLWWCQSLLARGQLWEPVRHGLAGFLTRPWKLGAVELSLGGILGFVVTLAVAVILGRLIQALLEHDVLGRMELPRGVPGAVSTLVRYGVITAGFLAALGAAGVEISQLAIVAGAVGVGVGFGLQNVVGNFVSGLILAFERPVRTGDTVQVGTFVGEVRRIGVRSSTLRTAEGSEVIVPNGNLVANDVINWTLSDASRRVEIPIGVSYGSDIRHVMEILTRVAAAHPAVHAAPPPVALFQGFGASSLDFVLRFWTSSEQGEWSVVRSDVAVGLSDALGEAGITVPFPQLDLHVQGAVPAREPDAG